MRSLIRAEVSAAALRANLDRIRELAPRSQVMAVVKANAYGHGLVSTALCLQDADAFAVARLEEALALRGAGVAKPVVLLEGVFSVEQLEEAARQDLQIVVHEAEQLALLERSRHLHRFIVWLKVDTGMNRLGFRAGQVPAALARLAALPGQVGEVRLLTHFSCADERGGATTAQQLATFRALARSIEQGINHPLVCSLANSAAVFDEPAAHADWIRPGLALYGVSPFADQVGASLGLVPAMRLVSTVIAVRDVPRAETVGYAAAWQAPRDSSIAIVAGGYGDGLPRSLPNGTPVLVRGQRAALVGRVSMDMIAVDVTGHAQVHVGDPVVLWGPELPVEEIAAHAGTLAYELLCGVSQRVPVTVAGIVGAT